MAVPRGSREPAARPEVAARRPAKGAGRHFCRRDKACQGHDQARSCPALAAPAGFFGRLTWCRGAARAATHCQRAQTLRWRQGADEQQTMQHFPPGGCSHGCRGQRAFAPVYEAAARGSSVRYRWRILSACRAMRSVMAEVALVVSEEEAPDVYKLSEEDSVEIGPFTVRLPALAQAQAPDTLSNTQCDACDRSAGSRHADYP